MRLAYADPPYPGKASLYPENAEVDHAELIGRLCEYDGWALSTDENALAYVLALCPPRTRVLAWGKTDAVPFYPFPYAAWEPVLCVPARGKSDAVPSFYAGAAPPRATSNGWRLVGAKSGGFCEWVIRCLGAERGSDTLDDLFPGTGVMLETWDRWLRSPPLFKAASQRPNVLRRTHDQLPGMPEPVVLTERRQPHVPSVKAKQP